LRDQRVELRRPPRHLAVDQPGRHRRAALVHLPMLHIRREPGVDRGQHLLADQLKRLAGAGVGDDCLAGLEARARENRALVQDDRTGSAVPHLNAPRRAVHQDRAAEVKETPRQRIDQRLVAADADRRGVEQAQSHRERALPARQRRALQVQRHRANQRLPGLVGAKRSLDSTASPRSATPARPSPRRTSSGCSSRWSLPPRRRGGEWDDYRDLRRDRGRGRPERADLRRLSCPGRGEGAGAGQAVRVGRHLRHRRLLHPVPVQPVPVPAAAGCGSAAICRPAAWRARDPDGRTRPAGGVRPGRRR
jgi:hypothetical protein